VSSHAGRSKAVEIEVEFSLTWLLDSTVQCVAVFLSSNMGCPVSCAQGERLSQVRDTKLVEIGVEFSLTQLLDSGFYHRTHPGNLLRTPDGKLAYLDFGMMGKWT